MKREALLRHMRRYGYVLRREGNRRSGSETQEIFNLLAKQSAANYPFLIRPADERYKQVQ